MCSSFSVSLIKKRHTAMYAALRKPCETLRMKGVLLLNYGQFLRKLRSYCINRSISNEKLVNEPIAIIIEKAKIKKEKGPSKGEPLYYEITEASRIINNRLELSDKIRDALERYGMEESVIEEFNAFYETHVNKGKAQDMVEDFLATIGNDATFQKHELTAIETHKDDPSLLMAKILVKSLKEPNYIDNGNEASVWASGSRCINVVKGDIFTYALGKRTKKKRIVVIPVNTSFNTHVTTQLEDDPMPQVSGNTIHGNLLIRLYKKGMTEEQISERIRNNFLMNGLISDVNQEIELPIGTIATIDFEKAALYLLAVSVFDENNNAHSSKEYIKKAIEELVCYYDKKGQGYDLYLPLIGTGMSRADLSYQESYDLIVDTLMKNKNRISGKINIVIQPGIIGTINIGKE